MKKEKKELTDIMLRYLLLLFIGIFGLSLIYFIFTPLTIYPIFYILKLFFQVGLDGNIIIFPLHLIQIIEACIAGAAYYLLFILNISTPMKAKQRVYSLAYSISALLILNILRIVILSALFINNSLFFDFTHKIFWYGLSTIFVVGIWFSSVYLFKIKAIPFYTDIMAVKKSIK